MHNPDLKLVASDSANTNKLDINTNETDKPNLHDREYDPRLGLPILLGMNKLGKDIYGGTVDPVTVQERRIKNKAARKARRVNRVRAK